MSRAPEGHRVRVVVVDDDHDMRFLLRMQLRRDDRFDVVGEGADGREAIDLARTLRPDLLVLDRQMPNLSGLDALPEIKRVAPDTAVVLYTAAADPHTYQAALDAGALDVLQKAGAGGTFVAQLIESIVQRAAAHDASIEISIGPVPSAAARVWVSNSVGVLEAAVAHPEISGAAMPDDVLGLLRSFLHQWSAIAQTTEEFRWVARASPELIRRVVEHWAVIDGMSDEQIARLGVTWSPPEGAPFFHAVSDGVLDALQQHRGARGLTERLVKQFAPYRPDAHGAA